MPEHGIHTIDTGYVRPRFDAAYLVVEQGRGAFIDCGTNHSVPVLMEALEQMGEGGADAAADAAEDRRDEAEDRADDRRDEAEDRREDEEDRSGSNSGPG